MQRRSNAVGFCHGLLTPFSSVTSHRRPRQTARGVRPAPSVGVATDSLAQIGAARDQGGLTHMHEWRMLMHMRTTLNIDDGLLREASRLTGVREKTALVRRGLEALIARESARRLAALGGSEPTLRPIPRRRSRPAER